MLKHAASIITLFLCALLVYLSKDAMAAARDGFILWRDMVLPALFPFFVCTYILQKTNPFSRLSSKKARPVVSSLPVLVMSCMSGAPSGARLCGMYAGGGQLDLGYGRNLAAVCNLASPVFIVGSLCLSMLDAPQLALPVALAHYLSAFLLYPAVFLLSAPSREPLKTQAQCQPEYAGLSKTIVDAIGNGMKAMLQILGTIIFFMVLIQVLERVRALAAVEDVLTAAGLGGPALRPIFIGLLEMTNGCRALAAAQLPLGSAAAAAAFIITFGGVCVFIQSLAFIRLNPFRYLGIKLTQACLAALLAYLFSLLFLGSQSAVFTLTPDKLKSNAMSATAILASSILASSVVYLYAAIAASRKRKTSEP